MIKPLMLGLLGVCLFTTPLSAAEHTVYQKGKKFSEKKLKVSVGDVLVFVNDDDITHNVHSNSKADKFDYGPQKPGINVSHTFSKPGKVKIRCAIHPKMKITVVVK